MTDKEILAAAIEKAKENGYELPLHKIHRWNESAEGIFPVFEDFPLIIFDHQFAKAFFGEMETKDMSYIVNGVVFGDNEEPVSRTGWRFHLQQMVLEENPIKYLEQFLK